MVEKILNNLFWEGMEALIWVDGHVEIMPESARVTEEEGFIGRLPLSAWYWDDNMPDVEEVQGAIDGLNAISHLEVVDIRQENPTLASIFEAMEVAGYTFDRLESELGCIRFFGDAPNGVITFASAKEVLCWLRKVVFDDPGIQKQVDHILSNIV